MYLFEKVVPCFYLKIFIFGGMQLKLMIYG